MFRIDGVLPQTSNQKTVLTCLQRLIDEAPYYARCSSDKTAAISRPRNLALSFPYMQVNRKDMVSWLIFDLDHDNPWIWEENNLPPPNLIVRDKKSNRSHLFYAINPVCTSDKARSKPIIYMKEIYRCMATQLNSDHSYSGPVAKTPFHPWWTTTELHKNEYSLNELADYVDLEFDYFNRVKLEDVSHSRNCTLFELARQYAYSIVNKERSEGSFTSFQQRVNTFANSKNVFKSSGWSENLPASEVKATVKSVSRWTWDHYEGRTDCCRGAMQLFTSKLALEDKQALAAKRTHQERKSKTIQKIIAACKKVKSDTCQYTYKAIAAMAGLSRQTVSKYQGIIDAVFNDTVLVSLSELFGHKSQKENVNYAVHQIATGFNDLSMNSDHSCIVGASACSLPIDKARKKIYRQ